MMAKVWEGTLKQFMESEGSFEVWNILNEREDGRGAHAIKVQPSYSPVVFTDTPTWHIMYYDLYEYSVMRDGWGFANQLSQDINKAIFKREQVNLTQFSKEQIMYPLCFASLRKYIKEYAFKYLDVIHYVGGKAKTVGQLVEDYRAENFVDVVWGNKEPIYVRKPDIILK